MSRIYQVSSETNYAAVFENIYLSRDENQPTSLQLLVDDERNITMNVLLSSNTVANSSALTNHLIALQGRSGPEDAPMGGEELRFITSSNPPPASMTCRWTYFGYLDPALGETHDSDTLDSSYEVYVSHTDPLYHDSDFDGLADDTEVALETNPNLRDHDGDGLPDGSDPNPLINSTLDADDDGLYDEWEEYFFGSISITDNADADSNSNGRSDLQDMLAGIDPAFSCCAVVRSCGNHRFSWTDLDNATNYTATISCGSTVCWQCSTNVCGVDITEDFSLSNHVLVVTAHCTTNGGAKATCSASEIFRQPSEPNLTTYSICQPFSVLSSASNTVVLSRSFEIGRIRDWGELYISSSFEKAQEWELEGLELRISGDAAPCATNASPAGDSLHVDSYTDATNITVSLVTTCSNSLALCRTPLNLIFWRPQLSMTTNSNVFVTEEGHTLVLVSDLTGEDNVAGFTVNTEGRPSNTVLTQDQIDALNEPFGGSDAVNITIDPDGVITSGSFISGDSGTVRLQGPAGDPGTSTSGGSVQSAPENPDGIGTLEALTICPAIMYYITPNQNSSFCECNTLPGDSYPFDSSCLRMHWQYTHSYPEKQCFEGYEGIEVLLGSADPTGVSVEINGEEGFIYLWEEDDDDWIPVKVSYGGTVIWQGRKLKLDQFDRCQDYWGNGPDPDITDDGSDGCGCDDGCESGDCSGNDGPGLGSVKFRVSLGSAGYEKSGGFIWFRTNAIPASVTPQLFNVTAAPSANITSNGTALSCVDNVNPDGRRITLSSITGGVRLTLDRYNDNLTSSFEGTWDVTKVGDSIKIVYKNSSAETLRSLSYSYAVDGETGERAWTETDNLTGAVNKLREFDETGLTLKTHMMEIRDSGGNIIGGRKYIYETIGGGTVAVERVTESVEYNGLGGTTYYNYHENNLSSQINGKLKNVYHADGKWEYHLWDEAGRETLRINSKEGSTAPASAWADSSDFDFDPAGNYADMDAEVTLFDYTAHAGDSSSWRDGVKPRTETRYRIANGAPELISRTWYKYIRGTTNIAGVTYSILTSRTIRPASQSSDITDAENQTTVEISFLDSYSGSLHLDGRPLYRKNEDGSTTQWTYDFDTDDYGDDVLCITAYSGMEALPYGLTGRSTYEYEELYTSNGLTSVRATLLNATADDPVLNWEANTYDDKGRLISTEYSDGTVMSNEWGCCSLLFTEDRTGAITFYSSPTNKLFSETYNISPIYLPGSDGYPVERTYVDCIGRVTNITRYVEGGDYASQVTTIEYPEHTSHLRVTTDHLGVVTTNRTSTFYDWSTKIHYIIEETTRAGVKTTVKTPVNGEPVTTTEWVDPVSGEELVKAEKWVAEILDNGYEKRTAYVKYDDGEWLTQSETVNDLLGRTITSSRAGTGGAMLMTSNVYDNVGLLVQIVSYDGSSVVYDYNELNERTATIRIGAGQTLDFDPLSFTLSNVIALDKYIVDETTEITESTEGDWWRCNSRVQYKPGEDALTTSVQRVQLTGLSLTNNSRMVSTDFDGNNSIVTESLNPASMSKVVMTVSLGITNIAHFAAGYETCASNSIGSVTEHEYDGFSRRIGTANYADGRELESVSTYHSDGSVATFGEVVANGTNTTSYSVRQAVSEKPVAYKITVTDPQGRQTVNYYSGDGQLYRSDGATYPNETARDASGRMSQLHTWRDENGDSDITCWHYDLFTGAVTNKLYADGNGTVYTYLGDGRIATREWARGVTTTYGYTDTSTGGIKTTEYSDDTPNVTNSYNLTGQLLSVQDGIGTTSFGYDSKSRQVAETNSLAVITRSYDTYGRYSQFVLDSAYTGYPSLIIDYGYDVFNRVSTITAIVGAQTNLFTYSYISGTHLISGYTATSSINNHQLSTLRTYEPYRNLITSITNSWNTSEISSFTYSNDNTGKRTARLDGYNSSTVTNTFDYNAREEVTNAVMNSDTQTLTYDDIGNRMTSTVNSVSSVYTANQLNQYTAITGGAAASPTYDVDGNLTYNGSSWHHTYDAENRLISSTPGTVTNGSVMLEYAYNYKNLRVSKTKKQLSGREAGYPMNPQADPGTWDAIETRKYVWDGFNIAAEIIIDHVTSATNISYYTWGIDLSGALQGAGGVGGLMCDTKVTNSGTNSYYAVADANGNITEYVDASGNVKAHGEHNAFGETEFSGSMKDEFTHWFSSKSLDPVTGLVQYQQRPYDPILGMFLLRDPLGDKMFRLTQLMTDVKTRRLLIDTPAYLINLYLFVNNDSINNVDYLGFIKVTGRFGKFSRTEVEMALESAFAKYIDGIREPLQTAIRKNWKNMVFNVCDNSNRNCMWTDNGIHRAKGRAETGVLRDVAITIKGKTATGYYEATQLVRKKWSTKATLCCAQLKTLDQYGRTGFHEAAHAVGWGGYYKDDKDPKFDNLPPKKRIVHPLGWGVPTGAGM